ncbi:MAG: (deoxy)nucleoside triphosphate pyrophosphohydrolase [Alphaproteobacteria bacterium]|nr:(deoxy)nucleoside triphosphate pyrophosphohydrolase [Alphaproteobacteria bacterium]
MIKVAAGVIKQDNKYLLMRRAENQPLAGQWEYPGGKVEANERIATALKRELKEELNIDATIGKMITSVKTEIYEIYAYDIVSFTGDIQLLVHDKLEWVDFENLSSHPQLPADKQISLHLTKTKIEPAPSLEVQARSFVFANTKLPYFDSSKSCWIMEYKENGTTFFKEFANREESFYFYIKKANEMIANFKREHKRIR